MLSIRFYQDNKVFEREEKKIFSSLWLFFAITQEFEREDSEQNNNGAYVRKTMAGEDIFIRKSGDEYTGFINRCPHRFHPIVQEDYGKTNLVCPYHYWSFDEDGCLRGIPYEKECYQFSQAEKKTITLTRVAVKKLGSFLFINLAKDPIPFEKQFKGQYLKEVQELSISFVNYRKIKLTRQFNWKLIQENLRDGLHPAFLHKNSLLNTIRFGLPAIPKDVPLPLLRQKDASYGGPDVPLLHQLQKKNNFSNPWICEERYYNFQLFPNMHIAVPDGGCTFILESYIPRGVDETEIEIYFIATKNTFGLEQLNLFFDGLISRAMTVYNEDFEALEAIQNTLKTKLRCNQTPLNGAYEHMILRFHKIYLKTLGFSWYWRIYIGEIIKIPKFLAQNL